MFFDIVLVVALVIFGIGMIYKVSSWFRFRIGISARDLSAFQRFLNAAKGVIGVMFSRHIFTLVKVLVVDVLFQVRTLKEDFLRWLMHMLIYWGFMLLLLMHALDKVVTESLFSEYYSTLNPFMFLRDLFGFMVVAGVLIAVYRRFVLKVPRLKTNAMDHYAIVIVAVIILSGILLEGIKITSYSRYQEMLEEYAEVEDPQERKALDAYWVHAYGLVSPNVKGPFEAEILEQGQELNESCTGCHSRPQSAFIGYTVSRIIKPIAGALDQAGIPGLLWLIHILACFLGLAYLPFSKMFHMIAVPMSLLANAVMNKETSHPANIATRQVMELDACTHCGTCSYRCSVAAAFDMIGNENILPSEKISFLKKYIHNTDLDEKGMQAIQEGIYLCTNCDRCTVVCPSGINLRDLWFSVREELIQAKRPVPLMLTPFSFYRGLNRQKLEEESYDSPLQRLQSTFAEKYKRIHKPKEVIRLTPAQKKRDEKTDLPFAAGSYSYCFACENCSTVCPVVGAYDNPQQVLGLLPHQIMRSMGLNLKDLAMGSRMLWDCLTCYQCQEHCPQDVKVTDLLYELKNHAIRETNNTFAEKASG